MAPFSEPQREGRALNEEAEKIIKEKEEVEGEALPCRRDCIPLAYCSS